MKARAVLSQILIILSLLFVIGDATRARAQQGTEEAIAEPPVPWPRSHPFDMQHILLKLSFNWNEESVAGEATLRLRPLADDLKEVELDAANFTVDWVKLPDGRGLNFDLAPEKLIVKLDRAYKTAEDISFTVKYLAKPKQGLHFVKPTINEPDRPYQIWSQGESITNHYWFPCYDYPNDRASSEIIATVESKYRVISNGELVSVDEDKAQGLTTYHWRMDQPFSSYLVSIIVGEFAEIKSDADGVPVIHYVYKDRVADGERTFANVPEMIKFYSEKTGIRYPFNKYAETTVRDFGGGMENITATTLSDNFLKDARAMIDTDDSISAHELAHQWFGDLVTCRDWSELWLNEAFASFMAANWIARSRGPEAYLRELLNDQDMLLQNYNNGRHRPIVTRRYFDPEQLFEETTYSRGQVVLHMLRNLLGEEAFWRSINHYLTAHRNGLATTEDLARAIEETTGQNIDWFFDQWVYKMGQPELEISSFYNEIDHELHIKIKQTQKNDEKRPWFQVARVFRLPVDIGVTTSAGASVNHVVIDRAEQEFIFPADSKPLFVNFDRGSNILAIIKYPRAQAELIYQLRHDDDITGRWRAARQLFGATEPAAIDALISALKEDSSALVRAQVVSALGEIKTEAARAALIAALDDADWRVRYRAVVKLGEGKDARLLPNFQHLLENEPSYSAAAAAEIAIGETGAPMAFDILAPLAKTTSWQDIIAQSALEGLGYLKDARALELGLNYAGAGHSANLRAAAIALLGALGKGNAQAVSLIDRALAENRENGLPFVAIQALAEMGDQSAATSIEKYLQQPDLDAELRALAERALSHIKENEKK
jgi:aminopeptidase N